ncbi:MAG: hypothetical protein NZ556_02370 [Fimbriimonadales bacterium]|nr:hypothetical protein [Fimbriimonadales bacterium]
MAIGYLTGSITAFAAVGAGIYLLRSHSPDLGLLRWVLLACLGAALISEGLYLSVWYASEHPFRNPRVMVHLLRNLTLDVWLPFAAALLSVGSKRVYVRLLALAMLWWAGVLFVFYWWDGRPLIAPFLLTLVWLTTVVGVSSSLRRSAPTGGLLLLAGACWGLLLVYLVLRELIPSLSWAVAQPALVPAQLHSALHWLIQVLNDWTYNSAPFWLFFAVYWRRVRAVLEKLTSGIVSPEPAQRT